MGIIDDNFISKVDTSASKLGVGLAIFSFIVGTILFILGSIFYKDVRFFLVGYYYTIGISIINLIIFIYLFVVGDNNEERRLNRKTALKMLINIPIAFIYAFFILNAL